MLQHFQRYIFVFILCLTTIWVYGQDIHFTNFRQAPVSFNPGLTGSFAGSYRISAIYRDQWRSISNSQPYKTPFISAEVNIKQGLLSKYDWIAGGMSFYSDKSGTNGFKNQLAALTAGYHFSADKSYDRVFSVGLSYGSGSQGFNVFELSFPSQLAGGDTEQFRSDENGNLDRSFSDLTLGIAYKVKINNEGDMVRFGITGAHLNGPNISLTGSQANTNPNPDPDPQPPITNNRIVNLGRRILLSGEGSFQTAEKVRINPAMLIQAMSSSAEIAVQATADYLLDAKKGNIVTGGLGYRVGDAVELIAGVQLKDFKIGLSYDLTVGSVSRAGGGAFELSVGYIGRIYKDPKADPVIFCPQL